MIATVPTDLERFRASVSASLHAHPILRTNRYTAWFSTGAPSDEHLRRFVVQFSVFSHLFVEAQLRKCINAPDIASYRASKEILLNELGVTFTRSGSVDGGRFAFRAAHFEWLAEFAAALGLEWRQIGKRAMGMPSTLQFCDTLLEWYGSSDESSAAGASYAIEHWAAAGFWKDLIRGLRRIKAARWPDLPLGFWTWHDRLEERHAAHTDDELAQTHAKSGFSALRFLAAGNAVLDGVALFWNGLEADAQTSARQISCTVVLRSTVSSAR
jgi:hypothetical protein